MAELARTLSALADPTRLAVIDILKHGPRRASELAEAVASSRPAMSRHLRVLRHAELVTEDSPTQDARVREYRLRHEPLADLGEWLAEVEAFWGEQLASFRAHVERRGGRGGT